MTVKESFPLDILISEVLYWKEPHSCGGQAWAEVRWLEFLRSTLGMSPAWREMLLPIIDQINKAFIIGPLKYGYWHLVVFWKDGKQSLSSWGCLQLRRKQPSLGWNCVTCLFSLFVLPSREEKKIVTWKPRHHLQFLEQKSKADWFSTELVAVHFPSQERPSGGGRGSHGDQHWWSHSRANIRLLDNWPRSTFFPPNVQRHYKIK